MSEHDDRPVTLSELQTELRTREDASTTRVLVRACIDILGIGRDGEAQKDGVLGRLARHDQQIEDMGKVLAELKRHRYVQLVACAAIILWVAVSLYDREQDRRGGAGAREPVVIELGPGEALTASP